MDGPKSDTGAVLVAPIADMGIIHESETGEAVALKAPSVTLATIPREVLCSIIEFAFPHGWHYIGHRQHRDPNYIRKQLDLRCVCRLFDQLVSRFAFKSLDPTSIGPKYLKSSNTAAWLLATKVDVLEDRFGGPCGDIFRAVGKFDAENAPLPPFSPERDFLTKVACTLFVATRGLAYTIKEIKQKRELSKVQASPYDKQIDNSTAILMASFLGIEPLVERLLSSQQSRAHYATWHNTIFGCPPIYAATLGNQPSIVRLLLDLGADPYERCEARVDKRYVSSLELAVQLEHIEIVEAILSRPAKVYSSPWSTFSHCISYASTHGKLEVLKMFLSPDRDFKINLKAGGNVNCIFLAEQGGHQQTMKFLAEQPRIDPNTLEKVGGYKVGPSALIRAAERGWVDVVEALLKHPKTDPNLKVEIPVMPCDGRYYEGTALSSAARHGFTDVVVALLDHPITNRGHKVRDEDGSMVTAAEIALANEHLDTWKKLMTYQPASRSRKRPAEDGDDDASQPSGSNASKRARKAGTRSS
ncbi:ankyrin repeat-containing domain protein [Podospora aff. communis PSN243]|uniref:Ankyrin repeat-containing domain protein n=1 Tax=Podospora aff. communis PSN243 TaxID=3040156 RepID=A0AAV9GEX0_9PEZI|nr:ankyrin repeat-containing domain protein [Podospora aff. communis PSN243]